MKSSNIKRIESMATGYNEARQKRAVSSTEFAIHPDMRLTMSLKDFSSTRSKRSLTEMFAEALLSLKFVISHLFQFSCSVWNEN